MSAGDDGGALCLDKGRPCPHTVGDSDRISTQHSKKLRKSAVAQQHQPPPEANEIASRMHPERSRHTQFSHAAVTHGCCMQHSHAVGKVSSPPQEEAEQVHKDQDTASNRAQHGSPYGRIGTQLTVPGRG
jgi:hypothetical protein